eukprot:g3454.t1
MMSQPTVSSGASASAPAKPRALVSRPQLYVSGEVECGGVCATDMSQMYCSFRFRFIKSNWWLLNGEEAGDTFVADAHNGMCVWNHPFQAHFAYHKHSQALSLEGWPRLELTVRGQDGDGRNQLAGYGQILIPTRPGCHELIVQCWRPKSGQKPLRQKLLGEVRYKNGLASW